MSATQQLDDPGAQDHGRTRTSQFAGKPLDIGIDHLASPLALIQPDGHKLRLARTNSRCTMDVWNASSCGLVDPACLDQLKELRMGTEEAQDQSTEVAKARDRQTGPTASTTYLLGEPSYVPYESNGVTRYQSGDDMCQNVVDMVFCCEVRSSVTASPLARTALITAACIRASHWSEHEGWTKGGLGLVAAAAPKKGGEAIPLINEYLQRHATAKQSVAPMVMRDFFASIFAWQFMRCTDRRILDLCGSVLCLTTAIDYVEAPDDSCSGGRDIYLAAASEGVGYLSGSAATRALRDIVIADSFMITKDAMADRCKEITNLDAFIRATGGQVTPEEFLLARYWDGAMVPFNRLILSTTGYRHLTDEFGTLCSANTCGKIKLAIDSSLRYNETVDVIPDYANRECFNELLLALAIGGSAAARGYAHAIAKVTDDTLVCGCGAVGHQEAAEAAMGACLWYLLAPRYIARKQLRNYATAVDVVRDAYAWLTPGTRLKAVAGISLQPSNILHGPTWQPLWQDTVASGSDADQPELVHGLARRIVRRSLVDDAGEEAIRSCEVIASSVLADCDSLSGVERLAALPSKWCLLFETVLACVPPDTTAVTYLWIDKAT